MKFQYRAINAEGGMVTGTLTADTSRAATRALQRQGLNVMEVQGAKEAGAKSGRSVKPPKSADVLLYMHQLCTLLESGVALDEAVESLAESSGQPGLARAFETMAIGLRRGETFSQAFKNSELKVPGYFHPLAQAGELTGKLAQSLRDGVKQWEFELQTANELRNALTYPVILIVSGIGAVLLIFTVVVPKFANLLAKSQGEVPLLAKIVLGLGQFVNQNIWLVGVLFFLMIAGGIYAMTNPELRHRARNLLARAPVLGPWVQEADLGRWATMMATLLENKVPLLGALELAQQYVLLASLQAGLTHVIRSVRAGRSLAESLFEAGAITITGHNLVRVGERSGELPRMLRSLATLYVESGRNRIKRVMLLVEPVAIIVIGAVVGLIMGGIIMAITSVNNIKI